MRAFFSFMIFSFVFLSACGILRKDKDSSNSSDDKKIEKPDVKNSEDQVSNTDKAFAEVQGSWRLVKILCGDEESSISPSEALKSDAIVSMMHINGKDKSYREMTLMGCTIRADFKNMHITKDKEFGFEEQPTTCTPKDACEPLAEACANKGGKDEYPYKLEDKKMYVTMGELGRKTGCGAEQDSNVVQFIYEKQNDKSAK